MRWKYCRLLILAAFATAASHLPMRTIVRAQAPPPTTADQSNSDAPAVAPVAEDAPPAALENDPQVDNTQPPVDETKEPNTTVDATETKPQPSAEPAFEPSDPYADQPVAETPAEPESVKAPESSEPPAPLPQAPQAADLLPAKPPLPAPRKVALDPATLDGVKPGTTTLDELHKKWGEPEHSQRIAGGARESYQLDKLGRVRVTIIENVVASITVHIERPAALTSIAQRLALSDIEPVDVVDSQGELLGAAYPERGVLLGYLPQSKPEQVFQIVVEAVDAQPFVARAEARLQGRYAESLADVEQALALAPNNAQAHHLRGVLLLKQGRLNDALECAEKACELEPQVAGHRLLLARVLAAAGDYQQAINRMRDLLAEPNLEDLDAARALCQWGDFLAHAHTRDFANAIRYHQQAIQMVEPLTSDPDRSTRRNAKEISLDAHLGVAYDIGHGHWQQKTAAVAKWVDRAAVVADDLMRNEHAGSEVRLRVYCGALAAIGGVAEPPDISKWVAGTRALGQKLYEQAQDPTHRSELAWQLALAMSEAVSIQATRGESDQALDAGSLGRSLFDEAELVAGKLPTFNYERGLLCYRIGATYALDREDHAQAVVWFDRASPLLESPVPADAVDAGSQGETFVSMAVSYWEQENRDEALRLTNQGLKLMERAVEDGSLEATALAIPYGNLSAMHEELGDPEQAKWCADLASRYERAETK